MHLKSLSHKALAFAIGVTVLAFSGWASADPPSRVARLGYLSGTVSFSPAGEDDWVQAAVNRPLTTGDRLWADAGARVEIQIGGAMVRMNAGTSVSVLNLDDQIAQLQLTQGVLNVRVRRLDPNQVFEVDTPNLAFTLRQPGEYRIEVDPDGNATTIVMRKGQGEVYGEDASYVIDSRQPYRFMGTGLREYQYVAAPRLDEFDRWSMDRDRRYDTSVSARYVSPDVIGYQDLDANGTWRVDASYGNVWFPNRVAVGWAPYRDGHWAWIDPWGWTWVDDAPWGFAVSHYGRWTYLGGTWGWVPGPVRTRAYYAPALVVFVGGSNFQLSISSGAVGGVGWFPLGPREVYQPAYPVSRRYFENVNYSNTVINNTVINNTYNNINVTNVVYANQRVPGAVVAVPTTTFVQSQPVSRSAVRVSEDMMVKAPVTVVPQMAPTEKSVRGNAAQSDKPPPRVFERPVVARTAPPAARVGFAAQQPQLTATPGKPLDEAARKELKPAATAPAPAVKVVAQEKVAPPTKGPPPATAGVAPADARGKSEQTGKSEQRGQPTAATAAEPKVAPPAPVAQPPEQRAKDEQPGKGSQRAQPVATPPPQEAAQPKGAPAPKVAPPAPVAQPPEQRARAEQPGKGSQRAQPVATPPPPQEAAQAKGAPAPKAAPPAPATQPPEQRARAEQPGKGSQRAQPVATPPPPQEAAQAKGAPAPKVAPPAPAAQPPEQRARAEQPGKGSQRAQPVATPPPPQGAAPAKAVPAPQAAPPALPAQPAQGVPAPKSPQPQPASSEGPRGQRPAPPASKAGDMKKDSDEQKREAEERLQKEKREAEERLKKG